VIGDWETFFAAQAGASAALAGLVFVALSINLKEILAIPGLPGRAAEAIVLMVLPVFTGLVALVPNQSLRALGLEYLLLGIAAAALVSITLRSAHSVAAGRPTREFASRPVALLAVLPTVVAGALLVSGHIAGLDWQVAGTLLCLTAGIADAWVLLVEILR
jgi:modulator of FtsH protease